MDLMIIPPIHAEDELRAFLDSFENGLREKHEQLSRLHFQHLLEKRSIPEMVELQKKVSAILQNPALTRLVEVWAEGVSDTVLRRRLALWKGRMLKGNVNHHPEVMRLTRELSDALVTYQYHVGEEKSDLGTIKHILRTSPDADLRRKAWLGKHAISEELAPRLSRLIELRNQLAGEMGYQTYADLIFECDGLTLAEVRSMLTELTDASDPVYRQILKEGQEKLRLRQIEPWDLMYLLEQMGDIDPSLFPKDAIELRMQSWAKEHGLDLRELGIEVVCTDIPYNGLCMTIQDNEIRILSNPSDGHGSYRTLFHEMGHAFHSAFFAHEARTFRSDAGPFTEGMAEVLAYVTRHHDWLKEVGLKTAEIRRVQKRLIAPMFHYLRERTAYALAEYRMYEDPSQSPDTILAEMEHDVLGVALDTTPRWAANAWYISYPIYWQNYILADMIASQIHARLNEQFGSLHGHPEAFAEFRRIYLAPGSSVDWQDKLLHHTGSRLKVDALAKDVSKYLEV